MQPFVSVIIPIYNAEKYIEECIKSILAQTTSNFEIILVDDGSTDDSLNICNKYKNENVIVIHQKNSGVSAARNAGIKAAKGEFITFVDGDDWLEKDALKNMYDFAKKNNADACFCDRYFKNEDKICRATNEDFPQIINSDMLVKKQLHYDFLASSCLGILKREKVKDCFFDTELSTLEDWEYNFRALTCLEKIAILNKPFYHYRTVVGSASKSSLNKKKLTCLLIPEKVNGYLEENKLNYLEEAKYVPVFLLNHLLVILANGEYKKSESQVLKKKAKEVLSYTLHSNNVPKRQKIYIMMCSISPKLFCIAYHIKYKGYYHE